MRFLGNIEAKAGVEGRVFSPASFRKQLQSGGKEKRVLRKDIFQECLVLYLKIVWDQQFTKLRGKLNYWNALHSSLFRQFIAEVGLLQLILLEAYFQAIYANDKHYSKRQIYRYGKRYGIMG